MRAGQKQMVQNVSKFIWTSQLICSKVSLLTASSFRWRRTTPPSRELSTRLLNSVCAWLLVFALKWSTRPPYWTRLALPHSFKCTLQAIMILQIPRANQVQFATDVVGLSLVYSRSFLYQTFDQSDKIAVSEFWKNSYRKRKICLLLALIKLSAL